MALTTIPSELSSVSGISDSSSSTAITIDSSQNVTFSGNITTGSNTISGVLSSVTGSIGSAATATTQAASDNSTKLATTAYVTTALANLVDSAPGTLNTLNELAAALGDDANFSTTVTNSIATKLPLAGGTLTGALVGTKASFGTASTTDYVLRLTDNGVADYDVIFPDTSTYQLTTSTSSDKTFKLLNSGSGTFNLNVEGNATFSSTVTIDPADGIADDAYALFVRNNEATAGRNYGAVVRGGSNSSDESFSVRNFDNSATYFKVRGDGNVGIGTSNPNQIFHIKNTGAHTTMRIENDNADFLIQAGDAGDDGLHFYDNGNSAYRMTIDNAGQVGIGTTSPAQLLHVNGQLQLENNLIMNENTPAIVTPNGDLRLFTGGAEKMRLASNGKLGIGTDNPLGHLHVKDGASGMGSVNANFDKLVLEDSSHSGMTILGGANTHGAIYFGDPDVNDVGQIKYQHNDDTLRFTTASVERFLICSPTAGGIFTNSYGGTSSNTVYGQNAYRNAASGGIRNVVFGNSAWYYGTVGDENVIVGTFAAGDNTGNHHGLTGSIYIGQEAGHLGVANFTTAIGYQAGHRAYGSENTFVGHRAGYSASGGTVSGSGNTAVGYHALYTHQTSAQNTAIGVNAGSQITSGHSNILVGYDAGDIITTGYGNVVLGRNSNPNGVNGEYQIVLGHDVSGNGDNKISMGRAAATGYIWNSYTVNANWTHVSDERAKKNITNETLGLSFINRLRPVTFNWKTPSEFSEEYKEAIGSDGTEDPRPDITVHGMIAQEVKAAMDAESNTTFNGWEQDEKGVQALSIEGFVTPLIKAVQELSAEVTALKAEVAALKGE